MPCIKLIVVAVVICVLAPSCLAQKINFNRDIKPILSENCFACHGPDEKNRQGGFSLHTAAGATQPAESGAVAIQPRDPGRSELLSRVASTDPDLRMPPAETGKSLTAEQIALLKAWIEQGAEYKGHWAFEIPQRPAIPDVTSAANGKAKHPAQINPIDAFIQARLLEEGLQPAAEASRETLIRRVALDLTGLPPTLAKSIHLLRISDRMLMNAWSIIS